MVEAHNPQREMFSFDRQQGLMLDYLSGNELSDLLMKELAAFTGEGWEQEDDVTLVTLERASEKSSKLL